MTRTTQEAKELIAKAVEIKRSYSDAKALCMEDRLDFQRGRSSKMDFLDWSCWFLKYGDELTGILRAAWLAYIGEITWHEKYRHKSEIAIDKFKHKPSEELWAQGLKIDV